MHSRSAVSEYIAQKQYRCDVCEHPIFPGDSYFRIFTIRVHGPYRAVFIRREHSFPGCVDDPPEDDEKFMDVHTPHIPGLFLLAA